MKKKKVEVNPYPIVTESFNPYVEMYIQDEPNCFNEVVRIYKYRTTIELIEEPKEVYEQRLQELWDKSDNYHHRGPLETSAKSIGYSFKGAFGSKRVK